jgi:hypothetical protein
MLNKRKFLVTALISFVSLCAIQYFLIEKESIETFGSLGTAGFSGFC